MVFADYSRDYYRSYRRGQFPYPDRNYYPGDQGQYVDNERRYTIDRRYAGERRYVSARRASSDSPADSARPAGKDYHPVEVYRQSKSGPWCEDRFSERCGPVYDRPRYCLGSMEWKRAVDAQIAIGHVPPPPPRSDPWDAPLAPSH